jgi:hypothetical protein
MHRFGERDIGRHVDEQLGLEETYAGKKAASELSVDCLGSKKLPTGSRRRAFAFLRPTWQSRNISHVVVQSISILIRHSVGAEILIQVA